MSHRASTFLLVILSGLTSGWGWADTPIVSSSEAAEASQQMLSIGSMRTSTMGNVRSTVKVGSIHQQGQQNAQQSITIANTRDGEVGNLETNVIAGTVEQLGQGGEKQTIDIGSIIRSTVSDSASTHVAVDSVHQSSNGEVMLGMTKESNVHKFERAVSLHGKMEKRQGKGNIGD